MSLNQCLEVGSTAWTFSLIGQCLTVEKCIRLVRRGWLMARELLDDIDGFWVRKSLLPAFCAVCLGCCRGSYASKSLT